MINFIKNNKNIILTSVASILLAVVVFAIYFDISVVNPLYVDWIDVNFVHSDVVQAYLGWKYYRFAPWTFPLGLFNTLSYPIYTSIFNTISIPLFAIPFKIISPLLPHNFQYLGIWGLSCFVFQSLLGMVIAKRYTKNYILQILTALLFILLPVLYVLCFRHCHMVCHYFILLSFIPFVYDKMTLKQTLWLYGIIGLLVGAINSYILAMTGIITLFYSIMMFVKTKDFKWFLNVAAFLTPAIVSIYISGGFNMNAALEDSADFVYSFNLNGFFNSIGRCKLFSNVPIFLPEQFQNQGTVWQSAGFAYYGIGILALILLSLITFLIDVIKKKVKIDKVKFITILALIIFSIVVAISPKVTLGDKLLFEIPYPQFVIDIWSILRVTARFIWIAEYAILISAISYIICRFRTKTVILLFVFAIIFQVYDLRPLYKNNLHFNPALLQLMIAKLDSENKETDNIFKNNKDIKNIRIGFYTNLTQDKEKIYKLLSVYDNYLLFIAKIIQDKNILVSNFYFARNLKGIKKQYKTDLKNAKDSDLFIVSNKKGIDNIFKLSSARYLYRYNSHHKEFIFARTIPIKGMENYKNFKPISINAVNFDRIFRH